MFYVKPEVVFLGCAKAVIEKNGVPKQIGSLDNQNQPSAPAYDLDD